MSLATYRQAQSVNLSAPICEKRIVCDGYPPPQRHPPPHTYKNCPLIDHQRAFVMLQRFAVSKGRDFSSFSVLELVNDLVNIFLVEMRQEGLATERAKCCHLSTNNKHRLLIKSWIDNGIRVKMRTVCLMQPNGAQSIDIPGFIESQIDGCFTIQCLEVLQYLPLSIPRIPI